jgi:hypothetical protein
MGGENMPRNDRNESRRNEPQRGDRNRYSDDSYFRDRDQQQDQGDNERYSRALGEARGEQSGGQRGGREDYGRSFERGGSDNFGHVDQDRYGGDRSQGRRSAGVNYGSSTYRSSVSRGQSHGDYDYDRDFYGAPNHMGREGENDRGAESSDGQRFGGASGGRTYSNQSFEDNDRFEHANRERRSGRPGEEQRGYAEGASWTSGREGRRQELRNQDWDSGDGRQNNRFDSQYMRWREDQIRKMDDDYQTYVKEHEGRFHDDFHTWRSQRQQGASGGEAQQPGARKAGTSARATTAAKTVLKGGQGKARTSTKASGGGTGKSGGGQKETNGGQTDPSSLQRRQ